MRKVDEYTYEAHMTEVKVYALCGDWACLESDGKALYDVLKPLMEKDEDRITVDFWGVTLFNCSFFNASVGRLVMEYGEAAIRSHMDFINLSEYGRFALDASMRNAIQVALNPVYLKMAKGAKKK